MRTHKGRRVKRRYYWRQLIVDGVIKLWPIMPRRLRLWAFMNDGVLISDLV